MYGIGTKLFLIIGLILIIFSSFMLYSTYDISNRHVNEIVEKQAQMALQFDLSIRTYVADKIRPVMYDLVGEEEFVPETMSTSFVARSIFDDVREHFPEYILKFSSDDPRNPANKASPEELRFIEYFNNNPQEESWSGRIAIDKKQYYARFNARRMEDSCLHCHGEPSNAPRSLLERYGSTAGFHRPVGEVIALDTVAIPISSVQQQLHAEMKKNLIIMAVGLVLLFLALFASVKFFITNRLARITNHFADASSRTDYMQIKPIAEDAQGDEISILAKSFNTLARKLGSYHNSLATEIQERKKAEEELRQSKQTLLNVLDSSSPICITSTDFEIILANKSYYEIWPGPESAGPIKCYESRPGSLCHTDSCPLEQIIHGKVEVTTDVTKPRTGGGESEFIVTARAFRDTDGRLVGIVESFMDISERKKLEVERASLIDSLQFSLEKVKQLSGLLPICSSCKKIRDDKGYWSQIESYISDHSEAEFSHAICPECAKKYYDELNDLLDK